MSKLTVLVLLPAIITLHAEARADSLEDIFGYYAQRTDTIAVGAGNAKEVNSSVHIVNPWPPHVYNRNIPGDGERMSRAVRRYKDVTKLREGAPALPPEGISTSGVGGGSGGSSGSGGSGR